MSEPLLRIRNHHTVYCGDPPIVNGVDLAAYIGYFENTYGDQWIFTFDRTTRCAEVRGGDVGWNTVFVVENGRVPDLMLNSEELAWLRACWKTAVTDGP